MSARKQLEPMHGKPIMVNLCMNIEYWPFDRPMPRGVLPPPHGAQIEPPDVPNYSWVEYGMRAGMPRFMDMLAQRQLPASALLNAQVADVYASLMEDILAACWELVGHGWAQQSLKQADDEAEVIARSLARLEQADGKKVRAWLGPGWANPMTPSIFSSSTASSSCTIGLSMTCRSGFVPGTARWSAYLTPWN